MRMRRRGDLSVVACWREGRFTCQANATKPLCDITFPQGQRLIMVGELHGGVSTAADWIMRLHNNRPPAAVSVPSGGFAALVADPRAHTAFLLTDAFGIQPLYHWSDGERVVFADDLWDLVRLTGVSPRLDWDSVYHYLNFGYVPGPGTIFRDFFILPPGTVARCANGRIKVTSYWDMTYPADARTPERELARLLRLEIEQAVHASWPKDIAKDAVGCFLSGGTDSGAIAGIASTIRTPLKAYSIAFSEHAYNELEYARVLASRYGLDHHVHQLTAHDLLDSLPRLVAAFGQPFGNPSAIATFMCARVASDTGVSILLAGDGGDEIFGGNERYAKDRIYAAYHRLPAWSRRALGTLAGALPGNGLVQNRLRNFAYRGNLPNPERFYSDDGLASLRWDTLVTPTLRECVRRDASLDIGRGYWDHVRTIAELDRLMYIDLKMAIWGNDLVKVVCSARAAGIRTRFPFLDPTLASFTGELGAHMKVRGIQKRYLFKRALAGFLPERVLRKPKHGFSVPVANWIRTDPRVREAVLDPIIDSRSLVRECFTSTGLDSLIDDHLQGRWDYGAWLWALMMLSRWDAAWKDSLAHSKGSEENPLVLSNKSARH
jgi:asparagine synthase (glutamine-hydrolysing)